MALFQCEAMDQLKHLPVWRKWIAFAPLLGLTIKDYIRERISLFKYLSWKDRVSIGGLYLAFWAGLLAGVWQIGLGFYEGPNYAATRIVVVDDVGTWHSESRHNTSSIYWTLGYHFTSSKGEKVSRRITVTSVDVGSSRVREAATGDEILLRVGVPGSEPDAVFGINKEVRQGLAIVSLLLVLWYFSREGFLDIDSTTGKVVPAKGRFIKLLLAFFGAMYGVLWLCSPVIP